jgi:hypothetical protein
MPALVGHGVLDLAVARQLRGQLARIEAAGGDQPGGFGGADARAHGHTQAPRQPLQPGLRVT